MFKKKSHTKTITLSITATIIAILAIMIYHQKAAPGQYDDFAQCITDSGATFYGAFWCPHCQNQKQMFGKSAKFLPYVECSTSDAHGQLPVCNEKNITGYPTWIFADGTVSTGEVSFEKLASKTQCSISQ